MNLNESDEIGKLMRNYRSLANYTLKAVEEGGFVLSAKQTEETDSDMVLFDWDDTSAAFTKTWREINKEIAGVFTSQLPDLEPEQSAKIIEAADKFSRRSHTYVMEQEVRFLCALLTILTQKETTVSGAIPEAEKKSVNTDRNSQFYKKFKTIIEKIYNAPVFDEVEYFFKNKPANIELGIFTYGNPVFQLMKVVRFMEKNPKINFDCIWLTKIPKGDFAVKILGNCPKSSGRWIIVDDSPAELEKIVSKDQLVNRTVAVRFIKADTKYENAGLTANSGEKIRILDCRNEIIGSQETMGIILGLFVPAFG